MVTYYTEISHILTKMPGITYLMAEITSPITCLLIPGSQIHPDLQIFRLENHLRPLLVHCLRLPIHEQLQGRASICRYEAHIRPLRHDRGHVLRYNRAHIRVADRTQNAAPISVFAVQRRLDEIGLRDGGGDGFGVGEGGCVADSDMHELGGAFAVADDELCEGLRERREHFLHLLGVRRAERCDG